MKNSKFKKVISVILLLLVLFNVGSPTFAAINTTYGDPAPVNDFDVDEKLKSSSIMEPIALFFYSIASWLEGLIGGAFESLTGTNEFPWADKVIFNTVAFLDVNFLNPAPGSLFLTSKTASEPLKETPLATIVQKTYSTVMVLCIGFLGVIVGIMAIKLAITTIATEKAKYKQAIVQFATSLILLFCMHYGISLIFYINEQIVIVASQMLEDNIEESNLQVNIEIGTITAETRVNNFLEVNDGVGGLSTVLGIFEFSAAAHDDNYIRDNTEIAGYLLAVPEYVNIRVPDATGDRAGLGERVWGVLVENSMEELDVLDVLSSDIAIIKGDMKDGTTMIDMLMDAVIKGIANDDEEIKQTELYNYLLSTSLEEQYGSPDNPWYQGPPADTVIARGEEILKMIKDNMPAYKVMVNAYRMYVLPEGDENHLAPIHSGEPLKIITDMASYFKESAWEFDTDDEGNVTGWMASKVNYEGAFLYVIFFVQSLAFFIAYIKRFFYVVILALLAPAVILYDFFVKSISL